MKTIIDNNMRVFQVIDSVGHQYFCNLEDLNRVVNENEMKPGYFKIKHFWNNKPERVTKKHLKDMFEAHRIEMKFVY